MMNCLAMVRLVSKKAEASSIGRRAICNIYRRIYAMSAAKTADLLRAGKSCFNHLIKKTSKKA